MITLKKGTKIWLVYGKPKNNIIIKCERDISFDDAELPLLGNRYYKYRFKEPIEYNRKLITEYQWYK
jgi:hypothetical protein